MIAVTFALPAESSFFLRHLQSKTRRNDNDSIRGSLGDAGIEVLHTGVGETICRQRIARFLQDRQPDCLISSGFAGALTDELQAGDLVIARNFSTIPLDNANKLGNLRIRPVDLYTAPAMVASPEERQVLAEKTGAVAVDMETKFIARACAEHAIPMLSLRTISDSPAKPFPAPPQILFNMTSQRTHLGRLAIYFAARPHRLAALISFARRIARTRKILGQAIIEIIRGF